MRILMIDDHALFRDGMRVLLQQFDGDAEILEADGCEQVLRGADWMAPDMLLVDLGLSGLGGVEGVRALRRKWPETQLVVVSGSDEVETVRTAIAAGARGYILKSTNAQEMLAALRLVAAGGVYVPPHARAAIDSRITPNLTCRQRDVLQRLVLGRSNRAIAEELGMAESTVRGHVSELLAELGANNRTEAARIALERGLLARG